MPTPPTILPITQILQAAKLGGGFAAIDRDKSKRLKTSFPDWYLPEKIQFLRKRVQYRYDINPNDLTLRDTANLLWSLLGKYGLKALLALSQGGTVIQFNNNNQVINVVANHVQVVIGDPTQAVPISTPTPSDGDTSITLPYAILPLSENITYAGAPLSKINPSLDNNWRPTYGSTSTMYVFSFPLSEGMGLEFEFLQIVSTSSSSGGGGGGSTTTGLQAIVFIAPSTGNTFTVSVLGTFVSAIVGSVSYDANTIIQTGTTLDFSAIGGLTFGDSITIFYYPPT
jgi:hypothetical protein